ncbi:unnamed protein product [Mytilus coruscus]|uniref:Fibrinogen C-terminal domain-containing protein n=1 Tax=Mytilus coruscus TaxID=42192 RepID=A0A6J8C416_MYTCO|nr:unnamed protein product [Mytilus coruscus]
MHSPFRLLFIFVLLMLEANTDADRNQVTSTSDSGNDKLNDLTSQGQYELRVNLKDFKGDEAFVKYSTFNISDQSTNYILTVNGYSGTADNDSNSDDNCAKHFKGGWWYGVCHHSNPIGLYIGNKKDPKGMRWKQWKGDQSMKTIYRYCDEI